jgi:hypothetical protein
MVRRFGHDATGCGRNINANPTLGFFKGTADDASAPWVEDPMAKNWVTPQNH